MPNAEVSILYNFTFIVPSVAILLILTAYFFVRPRLPVRQNRLFVGILVFELLVVVSDVLSSLADMHFEALPLWLSSVLNMAYFVLFLARIYYFFLYTVDLLGLLSKIRNRVSIWFSPMFLICELITLSSFFTGAVYRMDAAGYHRGPLYNVIYICFFFYLALGFVLIVCYRARLNRFQLVSVLAFNAMLLLGNIVRILLPQYLVMDVFCLLAILIIFLSFENSALYTSNSGAFTPYSMQLYLEERIQSNDYRILGFAISHYSDEMAIYGVKQMAHGITLICRYLKKNYPELVLFNLRVGCFALIGPASMDFERIRGEIEARFRAPWQSRGTDLHLSVGFAHASFESGIPTAERVVDSMILALMQIGQRQSLDRTLFDVDHADDLERELTVKRALDHAVAESGVEVFLQPIVDAGTGALVGAEALARLRDEQGKLIPPLEFIPLAEKNGQISRLGDQVAERVCEFLRGHGKELPSLRWINVNLSPIQCMDRSLCSRFVSILERYGVPTHLVHLEITEESMIDFSVLLEQMSELWKKGFSFALDDYGSGYSNMSRVKCFPFTNIKLDMKVVWSHCEDPDQVLPTFVDVFKEKGFTITAEGIETEEMAQEMRAIGCDYFQGYYYSRPLPIDEFLQKYAVS